MNCSPWDRKLWGVELRRSGETPLLLGQTWLRSLRQPAYPGEPTRALLFTTRATARQWAQAQQAVHAARQDCTSAWRFVAVKVRETVWLHDLGGSSAPHWGPSGATRCEQ